MSGTYTGSCHCGAVAFEAQIDLWAGTSRCNCSICRKSRFWKTVIPAAAFQLVRGKENLAEYRFGSQSIRHRFCAVCGVKPFGEVSLPDLGNFIAVNVACLDDLSPDQFDALPISHENGAADDWDTTPAHVGHL